MIHLRAAHRLRAAGRRQRHALIALCFGLSALPVATTPASADASIVVDASKTQSDCGTNCDDLSTLQNIYQDANLFAEPSYNAMNPIIAALKMKRIRLLQSDVYCDTDSSGTLFGDSSSGTFSSGECYPLAWYLQWAFANHMSPHVPVASFMPPSFAGYLAAENWPRDQLARFKAYAHLLVHYIVRKSVDAGAPSVVFEVSNELDIADSQPPGWNSSDMSQASLLPLGPYGRFLWWINPNSYALKQWPPLEASSYPYTPTGLAYPYDGDVRRLDHGISPMHLIFAEAVQDIRTSSEFANSNISITVAGPAFASYSFLWNPAHQLPTLEEDFLDQVLNPGTPGCAQTNPICSGQFYSPLDQFSFHYYGNAEFLMQEGQSTNLPLETITGTIKAKLQNLGRSDIGLFMSEWGPCNFDSDINYSHKGAAWAAAFLPRAVKAGVRMGSFLILEDGTGFNAAGTGGTYDHGWASLLGKVVANDSTVTYYPKPTANVFQMYTMMSGMRRPASVTPVGSTSSNVGAFAASDGSSAHVLVYNYNPQVVYGASPDVPENVSVAINNLPFNGTVTVQRYLIDATHSNFFAFVGNPAEGIAGDASRRPELQMVETYLAQVVNGQLTLPPNGQIVLGAGVTYWKVTYVPAPAAISAQNELFPSGNTSRNR